MSSITSNSSFRGNQWIVPLKIGAKQTLTIVIFFLAAQSSLIGTTSGDCSKQRKQLEERGGNVPAKNNQHPGASMTGQILPTLSLGEPDGSSAIRQAMLSTLIVIASSFILVQLLVTFNKKRQSKEHKHYKVIGQGIDFKKQSIQYEDIKVERISRLLEKTKKLTTHQFEDVLTLYDVFNRGHRVSNNGRCLGRSNLTTKSVDYIHYGEVLTRTKNFADGLLKLGLGPQSHLGIYSINSPEYMIAEHAAYRHSIIVVPIYDSLGPNVASFIANQVELTCITCDTTERINKILEDAEQTGQFATLKHIILMNVSLATNELKTKVSTSRFQLHTIDEIEQLGIRHPQADHCPSPNDLAIICFTSGSTGIPKGVMLTHENVVASVATISIHLMDQHATKDDVMISILPLGHMFQRVADASVFCEGGAVAYYSGDIQQLAAEIQIIRPNIMLAVPRLLNRIYDAIYAKVRGNLIKKTLLRWAYHSKRADLERHVIRRDTIWDWLVFGQIRANLGGRVRLICVGSAPLSHEVLDFLRCALGSVISEGYGQTECVGPCTATLIGDHTTGHVGPPLVGSKVKLADFAEMGYYAAEGKGEILVKGPVVFKGYFKLPEKTAETIDAQGWLHTGDIGAWAENGTLCLIDRKKNIFKLSQGEYICPEKIENILINSRFVTQIFLYGESLKSTLVAIVVPDCAFIRSITIPKLNSIDLNDICSLNKAPMRKVILDDLQRIGKRAGLKSFELPKNVYIQAEPFTIEQGLLTPTLKSKRNEIAKYFKTQINSLYDEMETSPNKK